mmetsp:Transcript_16917/g.40231  ORF Transcript_16917/g.40231 Transcript_16917/m.40231 type:complete len:576 (-) Transcript_16917:400-2127(-)
MGAAAVGVGRSAQAEGLSFTAQYSLVPMTAASAAVRSARRPGLRGADIGRDSQLSRGGRRDGRSAVVVSRAASANSQLAVAVQAGQEHVDAEEGEGRHQQAHQRPPGRGHAAQPLHQPHMQPGGVVEPDDQCPGFLRVPAPVAAPGLGGPEGAQDGGDGEEREAQRDGLVHQVVELGQVGQAGDQVAAQRDAQAEEDHHTGDLGCPAVQALGGLRADATQQPHRQDQRDDAARHADQANQQRPQRGRLQQIGKGHHRRQGEAAIADEIGRHMDLHPPALQRRQQRLDLLGVARQRVPEQEAHRAADHQHHVGAERARRKALLVVQVEERGHPAEQHKDLIEVADRDVADVGADLVALVPAHEGADQGHQHAAPGELGACHLGHAVAPGTGEEAAPIEQGAHVEQQAHPQNGALAGQQVFEPEHLLAGGEVGAEAVGVLRVQADGQQGGRAGRRAEQPQRLPEPAQRDQGRQGAQQDALLVDIHAGLVALEGIAAAQQHEGGEDPVQRVAPLQGVAARQVEGGGVHVASLSTAALSWAKRRALSGDSRVLDMAMRTCELAVSALGAIHTHSLRSLM